MDIYRNGVIVSDLVFNDEELSEMRLVMCATDGAVGIGQMTVPGNPGWVAGDRITVKEGSELIYTGYIGDASGGRNRADPLYLETTYQLMDINRQGIGRIVADRGLEGGSITGAIVVIEDIIEPDSDILTSVYALDPGTTWELREFSSDGWMEFIAEIIKYTGWTVFLALTTTENTYQLHIHDLLVGAFATLAISDNVSETGVYGASFAGVGITYGGVSVQVSPFPGLTIFAPQNPRWTLSQVDMKNGVLMRNGVIEALYTTTATAGGLQYQAIIDVSDDEQGLLRYINTLNATANAPIPTYSCTIGPLNGANVLKIPAGSIVTITSTAMGLTASHQRVATLTLTITKDKEGKPTPGFWDASLELSAPFRQAVSIYGYGGQGSTLGALFTSPEWTSTVISYDDRDVPVGSETTVTAQLVDQYGQPVAVELVDLTWTIEQWSDEGETSATTDYSFVALSETTTDISGQATIIVSHDTDAGTIKWRVTAE